MVEIPFSWNLEFHSSRIETEYGSGENPYEPASRGLSFSKFPLGTVLGTAWTLQFEHVRVYPQSFYGPEEKALLLLERDSVTERTQIEGVITLYDVSSHKRLTKYEFEHDLENGQRTVNLVLDILMSDLSSSVFENSQLCIHGNIFISPLSTDEPSGDTSSVKDPLVELSADLSSLLDDDSFSDVTIKCGDAVLPVHKNILSARSPAFAAMFRAPKTKGVGNELIITNMEPSVLREMLTFIYSGRVKEPDIEKVFNLWFAGDKYQLDGLVNFCVEYLKSNLSPDYALQMLHFARLYDADVKDYVMQYIVRHFSKFEDTEMWEDVKKENRELSNEILENVIQFMRKRK